MSTAPVPSGYVPLPDKHTTEQIEVDLRDNPRYRSFLERPHPG